MTASDGPASQLLSRFLSLPAELIVEVVSHLSEDRKTLCSLAQTCRLIHPLCEKHIYSVIELLSTDDLQAILFAFASRPDRIAAVHTLKILYKHHDGLAATVEERTAFNESVGKMKALKEWHVESPYDNFKWEDGGYEWVEHDMAHFQQSLERTSLRQGEILQENIGLAKLESLIIHSHGADSDFWDLDGFHSLFRHPKLRYLHVSCVTLPVDLKVLKPFARTTPLTTLVFDECELDPSSLLYILGTPKSLKHLTLGENVSNTRISRGPAPKLTSAPEASLQALESVAHSLESLNHIDPTHLTLIDSNTPPTLKLKGDGMRNFHQLKIIECDRCSFIHQGIILSHIIAPPNLEILRLRHPRLQAGNYFDELPDLNPYTFLPSLKTVEFVQPAAVQVSLSLADYICSPGRLRDRHTYAYKMYKHGINMKVYAEMHEKMTLIPPYLYGEQTPELLTIYDSTDLGFRRVVEDDIDTELNGSPRSRGLGLQAILSHYIPKQELDATAELPETDQLGKRDMVRLRNEVWRTIRRYLDKIAERKRDDSSSDDDEDDVIPIVTVVVDDSDYVDEDFEGEDQFEDAEDGVDDEFEPGDDDMYEDAEDGLGHPEIFLDFTVGEGWATDDELD